MARQRLGHEGRHGASRIADREIYDLRARRHGVEQFGEPGEGARRQKREATWQHEELTSKRRRSVERAEPNENLSRKYSCPAQIASGKEKRTPFAKKGRPVRDALV